MTTFFAPIGALRWSLALVLALVLLEQQLILCRPPDEQLKRTTSDPTGIINWATFTRVFKKSYSSLTQQLVRHKLFIVKQLQVYIAASKWSLKLAPNYLVINKFSDLAPHEEMRLLSGDVDELTGLDGQEAGGREMADEQVGRLLEEELEFIATEESSATPRGSRQKRDLTSGRQHSLKSHIRPSMGLLDLRDLSQLGSQARIKPPEGLLDVKDLVRVPGNEHLLVRAKHPNLKWWVPAENPFYEPLEVLSRGTNSDDNNNNKNRETVQDIPEERIPEIDQVASGWLKSSVSDSNGLAELSAPGLSWVPRALKLDLNNAASIAEQPSKQPKPKPKPELKQAREGPAEGEVVDGAKPVSVVHKDWRDTGCIAPPYFQGDCFSCYAISSMAFIEWAYCMNRNRVLTPLSAQYLISCGPQFKRESAPKFHVEFNGCSMGRSRHALLFVKEYGVELEMHMPYVADDTKCPVEPNTPTKFKGYLRPNVRSTIRMASTTKQLDKALNVGPVIAVFRAPVNFLAYGGGMIQNCHPEASHAMLIVGHGVENDIPYLLIKNSFGADWGEGGYFKFDRRFTLECVKEFFLPRVRFPSQKSQLRRIKAYRALISRDDNGGAETVEPGNFEMHIDKLTNS